MRRSTRSVRRLPTITTSAEKNRMPRIVGVSRAMIPYFDEFGFEAAFRDKGRFAGFMGNFGVDVVEDDFAALTGMAAHLDGLIRAAARN